MVLRPLVVVSGSLRHEHGVTLPALVDGASVPLCGHVVDKTTLRLKRLAALSALEVVLCFQVQLQLRDSSETVAAILACRPMPFVGHVLDDLLMVQELGATSVAFVKRAVDDTLRGTTRG
jgi:hypothetical protein